MILFMNFKKTKTISILLVFISMISSFKIANSCDIEYLFLAQDFNDFITLTHNEKDKLKYFAKNSSFNKEFLNKKYGNPAKIKQNTGKQLFDLTELYGKVKCSYAIKISKVIWQWGYVEFVVPAVRLSITNVEYKKMINYFLLCKNSMLRNKLSQAECNDFINKFSPDGLAGIIDGICNLQQIKDFEKEYDLKNYINDSLWYTIGLIALNSGDSQTRTNLLRYIYKNPVSKQAMIKEEVYWPDYIFKI